MKALLILLASLCLTGCTAPAEETPNMYITSGVYYGGEVITDDGNIWEYSQDDVSENENVYVVFNDNRTETIYDDIICYIAPKTEMGAEVIDSDKLSNEDIENRNGKLIIERVIGVMDDAETGAGHVLNNGNFYISYKRVDGISNGNVICSYFVYNPDTNYIDDIIMRFDYVSK